MGVGIEFDSETSTTENTAVGYFDYYWTDHVNGSEWGQSEISLKRGGSGPQRSHLFAPGVIGSFYGPQFVPATNQQLGDFNGSYPEYRIHASGSTSDANAKYLTYGLPNAPNVLVVPVDTTWMFTVYVLARRQDADNESAAWWIRGALYNNAGTTQLLDVTDIKAIYDNNGNSATWVADAQINGGLVINVAGQALKTIYWNAVTHIIQVSG